MGKLKKKLPETQKNHILELNSDDKSVIIRFKIVD